MRQRDKRARLVYHVQELERLEELKALASQDVKDALERAEGEGFDKATLRVVLKLRKMTPQQRQERRALEAIYLAALGMLEGDALPDTARRRLDGLDEPREPQAPSREPDREPDRGGESPALAPPPPLPAQPPLIVKDPAEARAEGEQAAAAGKRIYDNPYPAGDPCRAAWDEGWCGRQGSHGMETPQAFRRRTEKPPPKKDDDQDQGNSERGAA